MSETTHPARAASGLGSPSSVHRPSSSLPPLTLAPAGRGLWLRWMLLVAGMVSGGTLATISLARPVLTQAIHTPWAREALILLGLAVIMAAFGALQWLVLRPYLAGAAAWGLATAVTLWVGGGLNDLAFAAGVWQTPSLVAGVLLFGPGCGLLHYAILRRQTRRAGWWVLAWSLSWLLLFGVGVAAHLLFKRIWNIDGDSWLFLDYGVGGLVSAALSGAVLVWLLRQRAAPSSGDASIMKA